MKVTGKILRQQILRLNIRPVLYVPENVGISGKVALHCLFSGIFRSAYVYCVPIPDTRSLGSAASYSCFGQCK